jgi:2-iminobutanoate/2-iminopropanoate deaminase
MPREAITAPGATAVGPYSHAVRAGELVYLSGQTPLDPATGDLATGGIDEQARQCFRNLFHVLAAAERQPRRAMSSISIRAPSGSDATPMVVRAG